MPPSLVPVPLEDFFKKISTNFRNSDVDIFN